MQTKTILTIIIAALASAVFYGPHLPTHNLISADKAQAYQLFIDWQALHAKNYREDEETSYRFAKFFENFKFVKEHNARYAKGLETFDVELNKFADLDRFEFKSLFTGLKRKSITKECDGQIKMVDNLPASVDWSDKVVSSVKNQGSCGSCWAFSATGALESLSAQSSGSVVDFSPQQLVDCAGGQYENEGCNGGEMDSAFRYVIDNGITSDSKYPYRAKNQKCAYKPDTMKVFQNSKCAEVPANKTAALASAVYKQPVAIAVEADQLTFQFYRSGVFSGRCGTDLDHGIVLTGYGTMDGKDFWKCKNSWGGDWGMKGYILILKTNDDGPGQCGIMMENAVPLA